MSETLEIPLKAVNEWLHKETTSIFEPIKIDAKKSLDEIQSKLEDLSEACNKLLDDAEKEMAKGSRKTYRRAKFLHKLADNFYKLINEVSIPEDISGEILNDTSEQIKKILGTIGQEKTKWFRAISPYFIMSRRRFDVALKRADDSFKNFTDFLSVDYAKAELAEGVSSKVEEIRYSLTKLTEAEMGNESRKQKKQLVENKIIENQQKLQATQSKGEVVELAQLNERIKELTESVKHQLRHIQKPFLKFQTLVNSPGYSLFPEAVSKLDEYLANPFDALATEKVGYPLLKSILQKIDTALDNKKMKLKPSRLRKAKDQISSILNKTALVSLHKDCSEALNKKRGLVTLDIIRMSRDERASLHDRLKDLQQRRRLLDAKDYRFNKEHKEALKRVDKQKKALEKIVSELSNKRVQILLD